MAKRGNKSAAAQKADEAVQETQEGQSTQGGGAQGQPRKETPQVTKTQQNELDKLDTVSKKIRYLAAENYSRADIARILGKRYQHVRNVLITPLTGQSQQSSTEQK